MFVDQTVPKKFLPSLKEKIDQENQFRARSTIRNSWGEYWKVNKWKIIGSSENDLTEERAYRSGGPQHHNSKLWWGDGVYAWGEGYLCRVLGSPKPIKIVLRNCGGGLLSLWVLFRILIILSYSFIVDVVTNAIIFTWWALIGLHSPP